MDTIEQSHEVTLVTNDALSLITKAEIDMQISTAKAFPRSIKIFQDRAMSMATISDSVAASCNYTVPRGGKQMEGKSIRLAEIVLSAYGNVRAGARVIANDGKMITAQGICHDLETNSCITKEVQRKITDKNGKTFSEDMQIVTGNAACSIALRNAIFAAIPSALTDEVYEAAKKVSRGTLDTLPQRRDAAISYLKGIGVKEKQILETLELKKVEDIDLEKLSVLRGLANSIKTGEMTVKQAFEKNEASLEDLKEVFMMKFNGGEVIKDDEHFLKSINDCIAFSEAERKDFYRIINGKEQNSYDKVLKIWANK